MVKDALDHGASGTDGLTIPWLRANWMVAEVRVEELWEAERPLYLVAVCWDGSSLWKREGQPEWVRVRPLLSLEPDAGPEALRRACRAAAMLQPLLAWDWSTRE